MVMTRGKLLRSLDRQRIVEAIAQAERGTTGEIRVSVSTLIWGDVRKAAEQAFERMHMTATNDRNAVLFFVVPARRKIVVLGDTGVHAKVGEEFWHHIVKAVSHSFRAHDYTDGLVRAIAAVGRQLTVHFPRDPEGRPNQLPDDVDYSSPA